MRMHGQISDARIRRRRHLLQALLAAAAALVAVPAAAAAGSTPANSTTSANWSGYAIHGAGAHFTHASGIWTVPRPTCTAGHKSYSAVWVGIGGYALNSTALAQTGTETDCRHDGSARTSAWYELVPAPSRKIRLKVTPGDLMAASVTVQGNVNTMTLRDLTSHRHFTKRITAKTVDTGSAEWIVEAPSDCLNVSSCQTLPLANFGSVAFTHASAHTATGQTGTISNSHWRTTEIRLSVTDPQRFAALAAIAQAIPTALKDAGAAFSVDYSLRTAPTPGPVQPPPFLRSTRLP
jgi:hypothetical protein